MNHEAITDPKLSDAEICERYNISRQTLYRSRKEGRMPKGRFIGPKCRRTKQSEIETALAARTETGDQGPAPSDACNAGRARYWDDVRARKRLAPRAEAHRRAVAKAGAA